MKDMIRKVARSMAWSFPPIARVLKQRNDFAAENRRLLRAIETMNKKMQTSSNDFAPIGGAESAQPFNPATFPRKLNLGCGYDRQEGFVNVDLNAFHNPDLVCDVKALPLLPSGYYEEIWAIDVLEHLHRDDTEVALKEWSRLLKKKGILRLRATSLLDLADLLRRIPEHQVDRQKTIVQNLFGTQAYTGDYHYTGFTRPLMTHYLQEAGFEPQSWDLKEGWMLEVIALKI